MKTFVPIMSKNYHGGLAIYGVLPSLAGEEWPGRYDLYCDRLSVPSALAGAVQLRADSIPSRCYMITVQNHPS